MAWKPAGGFKIDWRMASSRTIVEFGKGQVSISYGTYSPEDSEPRPYVCIGTFLDGEHEPGDRTPADTLSDDHLYMIFPTQEQADAVVKALVWRETS